MSGFSRTNKVLGYLHQLRCLLEEPSLEASTALVEDTALLWIEQAVCALIIEESEYPVDLHTRDSLPELLEQVSQSTYRTVFVDQVKRQLSEPEHWLNEWQRARQLLSVATPSVVGQAEQIIVSSGAESSLSHKLGGWLAELNQLADEMRQQKQEF